MIVRLRGGWSLFVCHYGMAYTSATFAARCIDGDISGALFYAAMGLVTCVATTACERLAAPPCS